MADTRPSRISFMRAAHLCVLLLFAPDRFIEAELSERQHNAARGSNDARGKSGHGAYVVRRAFFASLVLVLVSAAVGAFAAKFMSILGRCSTPETSTWLQIAGASLLLWGTLFVRGWEIQTYGGVALTERVNQWLYRALYCAGTSVIVYSLVFVSCRG